MINEAYQVIKVAHEAHEMIEIINEVRNQSENLNLKDLGMRIGTEFIQVKLWQAGIICSKVVRYETTSSEMVFSLLTKWKATVSLEKFAYPRTPNS